MSTTTINRMVRFVLVGVLVLALGPGWVQESVALEPEPVEAQDEGDSDQATAEEEPVALDEGEVIVVTARRREESLQEVPVAVTVLPGEILEDIAAADISEMQPKVPNLSIYPGRNQSTTVTVFLRGIGQADPLWGVDPGVGIYLDDVYLARPQGALLDVFDIERVEVLRGPQGTLYGKNTIGGAIKYISRSPTDNPEFRATLLGGNFSTAEVKADVAGPLVEGKLRGKAAFAYLQRDGYGTNLFTGRDVSNKDTLAFRLGLDWLPSDNVTLRLSYDRTEDDAEPKGLTRLEANPFCILFLGATCPPNDNIFDTQSGLEPTNSTTSNGYALNLLWNMTPEWDFKSITAFRDSDTENNIDFDTTPARITDVFATYFDEQFSQEFQFLYTGGQKLNGVVGLYYFDGEAGGLVQNIFLDAIFGTTDGKTLTESIAIFGDGSYRFNDRTTFNFGARFTEEDKNGIAFNAGYTDDTFETIAVVTADYDETTTFNSFAPRLGLDYQFNPDVMGYLTLSRGHKSGGYNVRAQSTFFPDSALPFDDETLDMAELGIKSVLADRSLVLNTAFFYGDYADIQVSTFTAFDSDGDGMDDAFFGNFLNAGDATISGIEVEYDWSAPTVNWLGISGVLSYLDASPDEFLDENNDGFVDTQVITNAPEFTGAIFFNYNFAAWGGLINGALGYSYRTESVLTNEGGPDPRDPTMPLLPITQDDFGLLDFRLGWLSQDGTWSVTLNGKNLTDEEYLTNGYNIPVLGILQGSFGAPRTATLSLGYNFF